MLLQLELVASERGVSCNHLVGTPKKENGEPNENRKRHVIFVTHKGSFWVADLEVRGTHTSLTAWSAGALISNGYATLQLYTRSG